MFELSNGFCMGGVSKGKPDVDVDCSSTYIFMSNFLG